MCVCVGGGGGGGGGGWGRGDTSLVGLVELSASPSAWKSPCLYVGDRRAAIDNM